MDCIEDGNRNESRIIAVPRVSDTGLPLEVGENSRPKTTNDTIALSSEARGKYSHTLEEEKRQQAWLQANRPRKTSVPVRFVPTDFTSQAYSLSANAQKPLLMHALAAAAGRLGCG